ncbi:MAG: hypothetical protein CV087_06825 [Candidatus Brocadia sp. WS118]|nr:MAG: hypothetical protein CV087_06825 [Candidatus Brocadia sp. WS118]
MGYPIGSNIFKAGSIAQTYFSRFPIQATILFSPSDKDFADAFRHLFLHLDQLTGDDLVFCAILDPPEDWLAIANSRAWWHQYWEEVGQTGFRLDDKVLIREIARLFGLSWASLPAIVVGTNLWNGVYVTCPTSQWVIEDQFKALIKLAQEWGQPNLDQIEDTLTEITEKQCQTRSLNYYGLKRLETFYEYGEVGGLKNGLKFRSLLGREIGQVRATLYNLRVRNKVNKEISLQEVSNSDDYIDVVLEETLGRLIAPSTIAGQIWERLYREEGRYESHFLEEESRIMVNTALRVGNFLELESRSEVPLGIPVFDARNLSHRIDFTPAAQGVWKSMELEVNHSLVQAARKSRTIPMPEYYVRYFSGFPKEKSKVSIKAMMGNRPHYVDINQQDRNDLKGIRHKFFTLGAAKLMIDSLTNNTGESFDKVIYDCIGSPLPANLLENWEILNQIRNRGSHISSINLDQYYKVMDTFLSSEVIEKLGRIKEVLRR